MLKISFVSIIIALGLSASAKTLNATSPKPAPGTWTCYAQGEVDTGMPGQEIWDNAYGDGPTQIDAEDAAYNDCQNQMLQMCEITQCFQNK